MLTWFVNYKDGTRHDYNPDTFNIAHIDKEKTDTLVIYDPNNKNKIPILVIHFDDPRKRPIYVRRIEKPGIRKFETICHIVGWQMKVGGENIQSISYVFETKGRTEIREIKMDDGTKVKQPFPADVHWIENAGPFNRARNSWFSKPENDQLNMIGSKI